jgi:peptide/nickel transport system substrate-binding protein
LNPAIPQLPRSLAHARELLKSAGFSWNSNGSLIDARGQAVEFTIIASSSNAERLKMAAIIQDDLKGLGISIQVVPLEYRALVDRVFKTLDYDACVLRIASGDADPNSDMNVWVSNGSTHLWNLGQSHPSTPWEARIDILMAQQATTLKYQARKRIYDEVQKIVAENLPMIFLASGNILVGAKEAIGNFQPAILDPYTIWNIEELYIRPSAQAWKANGWTE